MNHNRENTARDSRQIKNSMLKFPILVIVPVIFLSTLLYFDGLFLDKSQMHGDAIIHGLSVLSYHKEVLEGKSSLLWSDLIYGGHPLHAETQFAFFSPLNIIVAFAFPPILGQNIYHWLSLILTGLGVIALCRKLGLSAKACVFASIAVPFSSFWLQAQTNITISGALALIPWAMWSFEKWLEKPSQYLPLTIMMVLLVCSGYPQILHGTAIYMAVSLISFVLTNRDRSHIKLFYKQYIGYGLLAVIFCIGISAVQLLPLLELTGLSNRKVGVDLINIPPSWVYNGLLFSPVRITQESYFAVLGSTLTCILASFIILVKSSARIKGHIFSTFILFNLGLGLGSPLYKGLLETNIPMGIDFFRITGPYFGMAVIGLCVMAATAIDKFDQIQISSKWTKIKIIILIIFWGLVLKFYHMVETPMLQYVVSGTMVIGAIVFIRYNCQRFFIYLVLALLAIEVIWIKSHILAFYDNSLLRMPKSVEIIKSKADYSDYKTHDLTINSALMMRFPPQPNLDLNMLIMINSMSASTNVLWDIASFNGAHALSLARRVMIEQQVRDEILIENTGQTGQRLIDYLSIKYVSTKSVAKGSSLENIYRDDSKYLKVVENTAARPKFQTFTSYSFVNSTEDALLAVQNIGPSKLIIEVPDDKNYSAIGNFDASSTKNNPGAIQFVPELVSATNYRFSITATEPGYFFIADANYPGWRSTIDGKDAQVFSAQILGKAVKIPKGKHELHIFFRSESFIVGLIVSIASLLLIIGLMAKRMHSNTGKPA